MYPKVSALLPKLALEHCVAIALNRCPMARSSHVPPILAADFEQGAVQQTGGALDLAIRGRGMFMLSGNHDGRTATYYGRDGRPLADRTAVERERARRKNPFGSTSRP